MTIEDRAAIGQVVQDWAIARDSGDWERFRATWHEGAWMNATWFAGPAEEFIRVSRAGFEKGASILHFLGGTSVEVDASRAIAQTRMAISQRGMADGVLVDVTCTGRFYDFFEKRDRRWAIVRRQPIYEKDRLDPVDPALRPQLDAALLTRFPEGYRHLAYLQTRLGFTVDPALPQLRGPEVERLYREGRAWLAGAAQPR